MASSRLQLISKKLVKPSISTSPSLRNYKLSLMDQSMKSIYMPMVFFYPNQHHKHRQHARNEVSSLLEDSLSKTLTSYYPFAGRINKNISVNCNDMGATLMEARIKCSMSELLNEPNINDQDLVFPSGSPWRSGQDDSSLLVAQLSHFDCGGKALSLGMSHKVGDGATLCNFINHWASIARQASDEIPSPQFNGASIMPPIDDPSTKSLFGPHQGKHCVTRRFVFDAEKLSQLKAKASAESGVQNPSRIEVVSALLCKCAMEASKACSGSLKPSILSTLVNYRPVMGPPVTQMSVGNFFSNAPVLIRNEKDLNFSKLVGEIRKAKTQVYEKYKGIKSDELHSDTLKLLQWASEIDTSDDTDEYVFTSACGYPIDNTDFGWGKPIRASFGAYPSKNFIILLNNHLVDGIDALVPMEEEVMFEFERNPELFTFASPGSSSVPFDQREPELLASSACVLN